MHDIMVEYKKLVEFLGLVVGHNCEIALQDVRNGNNRIIAIVNGHISGREAGSPLTNLASKILSEGIWKDKDFYDNYIGITKDNRTLRSSTYFIKENGKLLGMLCVNIDDNKYIELSKMLLNLGGIHQNLNQVTQNDHNRPIESENFYENVNDITDSVIEEFFRNKPVVPMDRLNQEEKMDIVKCLEGKGVFMVKGTVSQVAKKLNISDASLYRYLSKIAKNNKKSDTIENTL